MNSKSFKNFRAYFITNMRTPGIHAGIQSAHCLHEMYSKHKDNEILNKWADKDKTIIILNGGEQSNLTQIYAAYDKCAGLFKLPFAKFHEPELNKTLTCVGIVLPSQIYAPTKKFDGSTELRAVYHLYNTLHELKLAT